MTTIIFDIETGPLPAVELAAMVEPFDPMEVKFGNLKDPDKIAAKLLDARTTHERDTIERAALDATTGRVLAIGLHWPDTGDTSILEFEDEARLLRTFWEVTRGEMGRTNEMVGFNIHSFDLPFLIRRSWKHRVQVPLGIRHGRYWTDEMVDLRDEWQLGDRQAKGSLSAICRHLGLGDKAGNGADFACLFATDHETAIQYLQKDLELTTRLWRVLCP